MLIIALMTALLTNLWLMESMKNNPVSHKVIVTCIYFVSFLLIMLIILIKS